MRDARLLEIEEEGATERGLARWSRGTSSGRRCRQVQRAMADGERGVGACEMEAAHVCRWAGETPRRDAVQCAYPMQRLYHVWLWSANWGPMGAWNRDCGSASMITQTRSHRLANMIDVCMTRRVSSDYAVQSVTTAKRGTAEICRVMSSRSLFIKF